MAHIPSSPAPGHRVKDHPDAAMEESKLDVGRGTIAGAELDVDARRRPVRVVRGYAG